MRFIHRFPESPDPAAPKLLSEEPDIHPTCHVVRSAIGRWTQLMEHTRLVESSFGDYSYTAGNNSIIYSDIGKFANIASSVRINPGNHPMERVTQHHFLYRRRQYQFGEFDDETFFDWRRAHRCVLGHDIWIGHAAILLPGVKIGNGAVVGAGAVVTKDVPPYWIFAGVPARPIRPRFPPDVAQAIEKLAWWDWPHQTIRERLPDFNDPVSFIEKYA